MIIAFHSYKGGTGKTLLSVNMATLFAKMGKKVCLLDLDLRAPSVHSFFKSGSNYWVNDYLSKACEIEKVLADCTTRDMGKGKLFVGLANPSTEAIREMMSKNRQWEMEALTRLFSLKASLLNGMRFSYVFFDTSPGLLYASINAIVSADIVLVVASTDRSDVEGTQRMIHDLYELFEKKTGIIMNKIPLQRQEKNAVKLETHGLPIVGVVPCFCDVLNTEGNCLFVSEKPNHPFTKTLQGIAANLMAMKGYSALPALKPLKLEKCASDDAVSVPQLR